MTGIVIHHWLLFIPFGGRFPFFSHVAELVRTVGGTAVHLFFILSGAGLTISYFKRTGLSWGYWAYRRFRKIVIPYLIIVTLGFILANVMSCVLPDQIRSRYSLITLLTYLTFSRNFYEPGWSLNPTLWFMPVIIGLYFTFPLLITILKKWGIPSLLFFSTILTYGSISLAISFGYPVAHQTALFPFYVIEFSLGITFGHMIVNRQERLGNLVTSKALCLGLACYALSWWLQSSWSLGNAYNDLLTALGIFLVTLYFSEWLVRKRPTMTKNFFNPLSKYSYLMYLIHGPLILYLVKPLLGKVGINSINSLITIFLSILFWTLIYFFAKAINPLVSWSVPSGD